MGQQIDYDARWTDKDSEAFTKFSAVDFADKVTTPLLILHGEAKLDALSCGLNPARDLLET